MLKEAKNTEKTKMQFPLLFWFGFSCFFFSYFPVTQVCLSGELVRCWSFVLKSNCLFVSQRGWKTLIYFCPNFAARASVFLQSASPLTSSPGAGPALPYFFHSIVYCPLSKTQQSFEKYSVLPQHKLTDSRGPLQSCVSLAGWQLPSDYEQIIAYSLSEVLFETFHPQESTQSSEVIGWSDLILAHDSLRTNPSLLLRTFPCRSPALLVLFEFTDD